jgi:5-methylcytosine-specific restriction endonuclease McrA
MPPLRDQVRQRAKSRCEYCQLPQTCTVLPHEIDHILAQKHGQTSLENLRLACAQCNEHS